MREIFLSFGPDAAALAAALAERLRQQGITITRHGTNASDAPEARIERAERIVCLVTPGWATAVWPRLERGLARAANGPAVFLAKLLLVDLSEGASVPVSLRPIAKSCGVASADVEAIGASLRLDASASGSPAAERRDVFVVGHPGSGKSTFCTVLQAGFAARDIPVMRLDPYPFLQALFRLDALRQDTGRQNTTRFESDPLCEFVITDTRVLDEAVVLMKSRLATVSSGAAVVELAFSEGAAMADLLASRPAAPIVHVDAPLEACIRNNAARGAILQEALRGAMVPSVAFDSRPDVHHVPQAYYEPYRLDPASWQAGATRLSTLHPARYHRLANDGHDLPAYLESCRVFIDTIVLPRAAPAA